MPGLDTLLAAAASRTPPASVRWLAGVDYTRISVPVLGANFDLELWGGTTYDQSARRHEPAGHLQVAEYTKVVTGITTEAALPDRLPTVLRQVSCRNRAEIHSKNRFKFAS